MVISALFGHSANGNGNGLMTVDMCLYVFSPSRIERCTYLTTTYNIKRQVMESLVFVHNVYFARCYLNTVCTHVVKKVTNVEKNYGLFAHQHYT